MAESKGSLLAKSVQKHAGRAKEKLLQNLGKVDRTADEIFDEHLTNFNRQQNNAARLQKEFNNYIRCVRAVQTASKSLMEAISDVYETHWTGAEALVAQTQSIDALWQDFSHKLGDQVLIPLNTYTAQFPEMKKKIEKRNRKLIDYDGQRHSFQSLQSSAAKRKDDVKVTKGREQLDEARRTYEILNTELHDELPALHDSRILFLVTNLQTLFASEQVFHNETQKVYAELEAIVDKLATDSQRGSYTMKKVTASGNSNQSSPPQSPVKLNSNSATPNNIYPNANVITNGGSASSNGNSPTSASTSPAESPKNEQPSLLSSSGDDLAAETPASDDMPSLDNTVVTNGKPQPADNDEEPIDRTSNANVEPSYQNSATAIRTSIPSNGVENEYANTKPSEQTTTNGSATPSVPQADVIADNNNSEHVNGNAGERKLVENNHSVAAATATGNNNKMEELYDIPVGATTTDLPPGVLYRVKATYKYVKEDQDELSFDVGEIIRVIEYDDPDDQEEGWLMGQKEGSTEKGLFPANFTRPL